MNCGYRLDDVDPRITGTLRKEKEAQRKKEEEAWEADRNRTQREAPVQQQRS
jgi:hypothetical protein